MTKTISYIPQHVGIIMDGNGRWATARHLPRAAGHKKGAETVRKIVEHAKKSGVSYLSLFAFSLENWNRPEEEVSSLMGLLRRYLKSEAADLHKKGARLRVIGDRSRLDQDIVSAIEGLEDLTKDNLELTVIIALSYGGRDEIVHAVKKITEDAVDGVVNRDDIDEAMIGRYLMASDIPDPDLIIRTSGEIRLSNFLLWQSAYAELHFTDKNWPDFSTHDFDTALDDYAGRERRFGAIKLDKNDAELGS